MFSTLAQDSTRLHHSGSYSLL